MSDAVKLIKIDGKEYDFSLLGEGGQQHLAQLMFTTGRIDELQMQTTLLHRAKNSYIKELKTQILSDKAGFLFEDN